MHVKQELHGLEHTASAKDSEPTFEIDYSISPPAHNRDLTPDLPTNEGLYPSLQPKVTIVLLRL